MGIEAKRAAMSRKKSPPIFSHEFIIQNHGDIISCVIMFIMLGFMFNATTSLAQVFIVPQYNDTLTLPNETESRILYRNGIRDLFTIFFYTLVWIAVHCALQEYIFDKVQRRLHLSKTRQVKFNESGHTAVFSIYSICHAISILNEMEIHKDLTRIWTGYPELHRHFSLSTKLYYIFQISFWLHQIPEFYFQKLKREEIFNRLVYLTIFITASCFFYFANFTRLGLVLLSFEYLSQGIFHTSRLLYFSGKVLPASTAFKPWNFVFLITRLVSIVLGVIALWYGHRQSEVVFIDFEAGNFNTKIIRINSLIAIVLIQLWMLFNFSTFHIGRWREKGREQAAHSAGKKKSSGFGFKNKKASKTSSDSDVKRQVKFIALVDV
uniref:TLC domain-containing protein n=1 Tax=Meloidogyne floridensis TaxID=298350 RepID=A0A915P0L5_9BILA